MSDIHAGMELPHRSNVFLDFPTQLNFILFSILLPHIRRRIGHIYPIVAVIKKLSVQRSSGFELKNSKPRKLSLLRMLKGVALAPHNTVALELIWSSPITESAFATIEDLLLKWPEAWCISQTRHASVSSSPGPKGFTKGGLLAQSGQGPKYKSSLTSQWNHMHVNITNSGAA
jgi:hypothetical protein